MRQSSRRTKEFLATIFLNKSQFHPTAEAVGFSGRTKRNTLCFFRSSTKWNILSREGLSRSLEPTTEVVGFRLLVVTITSSKENLDLDMKPLGLPRGCHKIHGMKRRHHHDNRFRLVSPLCAPAYLALFFPLAQSLPPSQMVRAWTFLFLRSNYPGRIII